MTTKQIYKVCAVVYENQEDNLQIEVKKISEEYSNSAETTILIESEGDIEKINNFNLSFTVISKELATGVCKKLAILIKNQLKDNIPSLSAGVREWLKRDYLLDKSTKKADYFKIPYSNLIACEIYFDNISKKFKFKKEAIDFLEEVDYNVVFLGGHKGLLENQRSVHFYLTNEESKDKSIILDRFNRSKELLIEDMFQKISFQKSILFSIENSYSTIVKEID